GGARFDFSNAPHAGDHAPDAEPIETLGRNGMRLYDAIRGSDFSLLLFAGIETPSSYDDLISVANDAHQRFGNRVRTYLVSASDDKPSVASEHLVVIRDPSHALHRRYGATARSVYLIRPDAYVGYRSQRADSKPLVDHLSKILI